MVTGVLLFNSVYMLVSPVTNYIGRIIDNLIVSFVLNSYIYKIRYIKFIKVDHPSVSRDRNFKV